MNSASLLVPVTYSDNISGTSTARNREADSTPKGGAHGRYRRNTSGLSKLSYSILVPDSWYLGQIASLADPSIVCPNRMSTDTLCQEHARGMETKKQP